MWPLLDVDRFGWPIKISAWLATVKNTMRINGIQWEDHVAFAEINHSGAEIDRWLDTLG